MIIPKDLLPLCSTDLARGGLQYVYVDCEKKYAIASNGHILAAIPIEPESGEVSGYVSAEAIKLAAQQSLFRGRLLHFEKQTDVNGILFPNPYAEAESPPPFPDWTVIIPRYNLCEIGLRAEYLMALAKLACPHARGSEIRLRWGRGDVCQVQTWSRAYPKDWREPILLLSPLDARIHYVWAHCEVHTECLQLLNEATEEWGKAALTVQD